MYFCNSQTETAKVSPLTWKFACEHNAAEIVLLPWYYNNTTEVSYEEQQLWHSNQTWPLGTLV